VYLDVARMPQSTLNKLTLEPNDSLHFVKTPQQNNPNRILKLTNTSSDIIAFKVKTTAPKSYLVRPSAGVLRQKETQDVQIILQPTGTDGGAANNHRFLVQAVSVSNDNALSREDWSSYPKESIQECRLSVVLEERQNDNEPASNKVEEKPPRKPELGPGPADSGDLKVKYDELVAYTLMLEKEKKKVEEELDKAKKSSSGGGSVEGYSFKMLILVGLVVFLLSYAIKFISDGKN
jgi:DNA-directed RNA polymerase I, II, and III subunit RPABC2